MVKFSKLWVGNGTVGGCVSVDETVRASGETGDTPIAFCSHTLAVGLVEIPGYDEQGLGVLDFKPIGSIE